MDYSTLANKEVVDKTVKALEEKGYSIFLVKKGSEALEKIKTLIPKGSSVINGSSVTLETIGYQDYLKTNQSGWINLHDKVSAEPDMEKRRVLRKEASISDYYLGSANAVTEDGQIIFGSNTGSQLTSIVFNSTNLILVIGVQKIVPDLGEALKRLENYVAPLENARLEKLHGVGTKLNKIVIFKGESQYLGRKINVILVNESLGF